MKIFLDTAHVSAISTLVSTGLIDGVTTNPTHLSKEDKHPITLIRELCNLLPEGDISVEVTEQNPENVYQQAHAIAGIADNVVVKVPCHAKYYPLIKQLVDDGIRVNITLVFTLLQSMMMCKLGVAYISPFVGRLNDIDGAGIETLREIRTMIDEYGFDTELLAASLRSVRDVHDALLIGVDAVTVPIEIFEKMIHHPLTDQGMEQFLTDWDKLGIRQFP